MRHFRSYANYRHEKKMRLNTFNTRVGKMWKIVIIPVKGYLRKNYSTDVATLLRKDVKKKKLFADFLSNHQISHIFSTLSENRTSAGTYFSTDFFSCFRHTKRVSRVNVTRSHSLGVIDSSVNPRRWTFTRGRSRTEMERLLIRFCGEGGEVTRLARNWGQVQWERISES